MVFVNGVSAHPRLASVRRQVTLSRFGAGWFGFGFEALVLEKGHGQACG